MPIASFSLALVTALAFSPAPSEPASLALTPKRHPIEAVHTDPHNPAPRVSLLRPAVTDDGRPVLRLDEAGRAVLSLRPERITIEQVPLRSDLLVDCELTRFEVVAPNAERALGSGRAMRRSALDATRVALYRGTIVSHPGATVFLASGPGGVIGQFDLGVGTEGATQFALGSADPSRRGLASGDLEITELGGFGAPPLVEPCGFIGHPVERPQGGVAGFSAAQRRLLEVAVDTDHEFFTLFGNADDAGDYIVALFGAVSTIYEREFDIAVTLTFVRLWDTPDDLFNENNPLGPFVDHWNEFMTDVPRDLAALLTGRRNLPYGGVAYLSATCGEYGYSVNGYLNGSFTSTEGPDRGNWDLIVVAHEIGHNCGTLHTHDYDLDQCANGEVRRAGIMSYCHTVSGGVSNVDMRFESLLRGIVKEFIGSAECVAIDCDGNGIDDATDILEGTLLDSNEDGIPDLCQDCDDDGVLDPLAIGMGQVSDIDSDGVPDGCQPDCNGNGIPDSLDIALESSQDVYGDGVPDECEVDCNRNGISDRVEINLDMTLDVDRNAELDSCQDCDGNSTPDLAQLDHGLNLWVAGAGGVLREFHARSGAPTGPAVAVGGEINDLLQLPDGRLVASLPASNAVVTLDAATGATLGTFVGSGLVSPTGLLLTETGTLLIASAGNSRVLEVDASTGAPIRVISTSSATLPFGLALTDGGVLLVTSADNTIRRFDYASGASLGTLVPAGSQGLSNPRGLLLLRDGSLLVASNGSNALLRFDATSGAALGRWDLGGVTNGFWGLRQPWTLRLAADGTRVFASSRNGSAAVHSYSIETGQFLRSYYVLSADIPSAGAFVELPPSAEDCNLNGRLDACDIAAGSSADVNQNGLPDECEKQVCIPGDLDCDGDVDGADLGALLSVWGPCPGCAADLDGDGEVNGADLGALLALWG